MSQSERQTMLGLGDGPDEADLRALNQDKPESTKGREKTIKYLSDPALLAVTEPLMTAAVDINERANDASRPDNPEDRYLYINELDRGSFNQITDINERALLMGCFSNSNFRNIQEDQRMLLGLSRVSFQDGHLRITGLEINSPSGMNRGKLKNMLIGRARTKLGINDLEEIGLKSGMLDELKVDLDIKEGKLNSLTSGNGQRCFVLTSKEIDGVNGKVIRDTINEASQVENLKLKAGDIIFVGSKKVMDALVMATTNSIAISEDYYENALANQIQGILRASRGEDMRVDTNAVFQEVDQLYQLEMSINPREEVVASSFVVYQLK